MFCFQCEQARHGTGCETSGVCGKPAEVGELHDVLFRVACELAYRLSRLPAAVGLAHQVYLDEAMFATVSNVNFDDARVEALICQGRERLAALAGSAVQPLRRSDLLEQAQVIAIPQRRAALGADLLGLQEMLAYGVKGMAAIARQARALGQSSAAAGRYTIEALAYLLNPQPDAETLLALCLRCGEMSIEVMGLLDAANTGHFGHPEPSDVLIGHRPGKAILVSGHELDDLERVLKHTEGTGIQVYTHGEMMAAHGYPGLKRYAHLAGHIGGAWHDQHRVFGKFPGAIMITGACLLPPRKSYRARLFTIGALAHPELHHLGLDDLSPLLECALAEAGYSDTVVEQRHRVGFGRQSTMAAASTLVDAVRSGAISRFVLIGGCDGPTRGRDYYSELAAALPQDWAVLTLGCGKFRVIGRTSGEINGIPRLLDVGQCSDSFTAIKVSLALAEQLGVSLHELPLSLVLSWHEQKAVTVLLALLHLGLRNIRIGPSIPAFVTPAMLQILGERFNLLPIDNVERDLRAMAAA